MHDTVTCSLSDYNIVAVACEQTITTVEARQSGQRLEVISDG